jgi:hypothetical protein
VWPSQNPRISELFKKIEALSENSFYFVNLST